MAQRDFRDDEHFVRLCSRQKQIREHDGTLRGVTWEAFSLRTNIKEDYLSGALLEHFQGTQREQAVAAVEAMKSAGMVFSDKHAVAVCSAGSIRGCGTKQKRKLRVRHEPNKKNASYSKVRGLPLDNSDNELLSLLAADSVVSCTCVIELRPAALDAVPQLPEESQDAAPQPPEGQIPQQ